MSAPPIPDNPNTGLGVDGVGRGYFSRTIPFSKGGGVPTPPAGFALLKGADGLYLLGADGAYLYGAA